MSVLFQFLLATAWGAVVGFFGLRSFFHTGAGHLIFSIAFSAVNIATMLYFARMESVQSFLRFFGLTERPSALIWFAVVMTLAIRWVGHLVLVFGWSKGASTLSLWGFTHTFGLERYLYLAPAMLAPLFEELYLRGFLYRAFRGSYSAQASTFLILGITGLTHWTQVSHSWIAAVDIGTLTVLQCFLRERTGNLWDCIITHFIFNLTGALLSVMRH